MQNDTTKVYEFIKLCPGTTRSEIVGGTGLSLEAVEAILAVVVDAGEAIKTGEANTARYRLAGVLPVPVVEPSVPFVSSEQRWSDTERARVLSEEKAKQPKPEPRHVITDADIVIPPAPKPLSPEEREFLEVSTKNRRGANPQAFIVR